MHNKGLHMVAFILLVVGGLNWLLVGLFSWDIGAIFGGMDAAISRIIYVLVGLSAIYMLATHKKDCEKCMADKGGASSAPSAPPAPPTPGA